MKAVEVVATFAALAGAAAADSLYVGRVDTVGGTTYDWFTNGPVHRWIVNSEPWGIHAVWMASAGPDPWPDRNTRYNFYDYPTRRWLWNDTSGFMRSGFNTYMERTGFGNLGADPAAGVAIIVAHGGSPLRPIAARDIAPGAAVFDYCNGSPNADGLMWPAVAVGQGGIIHVAGVAQGRFGYGRIRTWCQWDTLVLLNGGSPDPVFPTHNIAASRVSENVCVCWVNSEGSPVQEAYYRISTDAGQTWADPAELPPPPAFGGDTLASFGVPSLFPMYDRQGRLHFVADVHPVVRDTWHIVPAEIWHWCEANSPRWHEIHRAGCQPLHIRCPPGYNAHYADRPSIGEDADGSLWVAWEQFDSINYEPQTNQLRAGVWLSGSENNGYTWQPGLLVTGINNVSHRYPCVMDCVSQDTVCVLYLMDLVAGACVQGQGPMTENPVVVQFVPAGAVGMERRHTARAGRAAAGATVVRGVLRTGDRIPETGYRAELLDISGRKVMALRPGANDVSRLAPGVYFVRQETESRTTRVVVLR